MRKMQTPLRRAATTLTALAAALATLCAGCAGGRPGKTASNWREQGLASWYGSDFHGRRTASGERYNMYAMTAAHKTLPLGTPVVVTSRANGRSIRVRVNDRGPFVAGRIIDLSYAAARKLGSAEAGVVPVTVEASLPAAAFVVAPASVPPSVPHSAPPSSSAPPLRGAFLIQVGAFAVEANAHALAARLPVPKGSVRVRLFEDNRGAWWRVRVSGYADELAAQAAATALEEQGLPGFIVRED